MITKPTYWTEARVEPLLRELIDELIDEEKLKPGKQTLQIGTLLLKHDIPPQYLSFWEDKYKDNEEICESIHCIKKILEIRINEGGLRNRLNGFMVTFNLKNNYNWKDVQVVEDEAKNKTNDALTEIRERLSSRTKGNIRNKKNGGKKE